MTRMLKCALRPYAILWLVNASHHKFIQNVSYRRQVYIFKWICRLQRWVVSYISTMIYLWLHSYNHVISLSYSLSGLHIHKVSRGARSADVSRAFLLNTKNKTMHRYSNWFVHTKKLADRSCSFWIVEVIGEMRFNMFSPF